MLRDGTIVGLANHTVLISRDGSERPIDDSGAPVRTADGTIAGVVLVFRDVEARRQADRELEQSEGRYRALIDVSPQAVWTADADGRWTFVNPWWTELTGLTAASSLGEGWANAIDAATRQRALDVWAAARAGGDTFDAELPVIRAADHSIRWHLFQAHRTRKDDGTHSAWTGVAIDMHDARIARESLARGLEQQRQVSERLRRLAAASVTVNASHSLASLLHVVVEEARAIIPSHQALGAATTTGNWDDAVTATSFSDRYATFRSVKMRPAGLTVYGDCLSQAVRLNEVQRAAQDGWKRYAEAALPGPPRRGYLCAPLLTRAGATMGVIELSDRLDDDYDEHDEATLVQLASVASVAIENSRLFEALHEADQRKDEFLAMLAHELRNPLAPIRNSLYLIQVKAGGDPALEQTSQLMARQVDHMARLVDDLLDVSRITRGKIDAEPRADRRGHDRVARRRGEPAEHRRETPVADGLAARDAAPGERGPDSRGAGRDQPPEQRREVHARTGTHRPDGRQGRRLREPRRRRRRRGHRAGRAADHLRSLRAVGSRRRQHTWRPWHRADAGQASDRNARRHRHGVQRGSGERQPLRDPPAARGARAGGAARDGADTLSSSPLRVLVVDDNRDSTDSLALLLGALGHQVRTAYDGRQALAQLAAGPSDLVILDIGLPGMSGYDVVGRDSRHAVDLEDRGRGADGLRE